MTNGKVSQSMRAARADGSTAKRLALTYLPSDDLIADLGNPRKHPKEQINAIMRSIEAFGFVAPIVIDKMNWVVAGHGRLEAAKLLGFTKVPVIRVDHLSAEQTKAYMLADNKLTDRSSWDDENVAKILRDLSRINLNFEIEATGFESAEIDLRIQSLDLPDDIDAVDDFEHPELAAVSQAGDLYLLGQNRILCGSALDSHSYGLLMDGAKAAAVFTDPPYNVPVKGHVSGKGRKQHREFPMASGEMNQEKFTRFLSNSTGLMVSHSVEAATFFACMDWRHQFEIISAIRSVDCDLVNLCVWVKPNGGMGSLYRSRHELVFVFGKRGAKRVNNVELGRHGRNRTNVWNYPGANSFARRGRTRGLDLHPTVKPIAMISDAILDVTRRGDIVLDPFAGSGTTILAAERTGRRAYAMELLPTYFDVAIARWERMTGQQAIHANGKTFREICTERRAEGGGK